MLMEAYTQTRDVIGANTLSVALIGPEQPRRQLIAEALAGSQAKVMRELASYPNPDTLPTLVQSAFDVIVVELDSDPELALDIVEEICGLDGTVTVMVYSAQADSAMLVRCMRAGAREFLSLPLAPGAMAEAMVRASVRRPATRPVKKETGKLLVFVGAKGGSGVTTIATNFAVSIAQVSDRSTLLIDFGLPIGDAALSLGIRSKFSIASALDNFSRLDSHFLATLLCKHSSGLSVLAGTDAYTPTHANPEAFEKLLATARQSFDYVIVDAGSHVGPISKVLFDGATSVYLITQVSISELRNSNHLILGFFDNTAQKPEIVLNRFTSRALGINESEISKALTLSPKWKIPSDYETTLRAQNTANALVLEDSPIARVIRQMARAACDLPTHPEKKKRFSLFTERAK